ncbi:hypothetical protein GCM10027299_23960 [Larkinella ripae]
MPVPAIAFSPCYDVHLLRGQLIEIVNEADFYSLLRLNDRRAYAYAHEHDEVTYSFRFSFDEGRAADFGIEITRADFSDEDLDYLGILLLDDEPPETQNRIRNFYLIATVTDGTDSAEAVLRIHIHHQIEEVWITPSPMTVYDRVRCSPYLRARFDDRLVADLGPIYRGNNGTRVNYRIRPQPAIQWHSTTPNLIRAHDGIIRGQDLTGSHPISVSVRWKQTFTANAQVVFSDHLTARSTLRAELVATGRGPGAEGLQQATNVLFLSDGFTAEQEYEFKIFVLEYVYDLVNKKISSPFDLLKKSINFWMVFVPSQQSGATYRGELAIEERRKPNGFDEIVGYEHPDSTDPKNRPVDRWQLAHLLNKVGLPVPDEGNTDDDAVFESLIQKWRATTRLTAGQLDELEASEALIREWQGYAARRLPDALDTALGISVNNHTAAESDSTYNRINFDRKRIQRADLDSFFKVLKTVPDAQNREFLIGPTFVLNEDGDENEKQGKDWDNVVIITAGQQGLALNSGGYMFSKVSEREPLVLSGQLTDIRMAIAPAEFPAKMENAEKATLTHELCHSFGLGDEYARKPPAGKREGLPVVEAADWPLARYDDPASDLDPYANLQARADLVDETGKIDPYKIKWRYHRIQKCGRVAAIAVNDPVVTVTLHPKQTEPFAVGNPVFLRKRQRRATGYFLVSSDANDNAFYSPIITSGPIDSRFFGEAQVASIDEDADTVTLVYEDDSEILELGLESGRAALLEVGQTVFVETQSRNAVQTILRTGPNAYELALSPLLTITAINPAAHTLTLAVPTDESLLQYMQTLEEDEEMIVYEPLTLPADQRTNAYPHAELIALPVLKYLKENPFPFNADAQNREALRYKDSTRIPGKLVPCCSRREKEIIGLYSGGKKHHGGIYHPSAQCLMRHEYREKEKKYVELCAVCRYTLVNLIDPTQFGAFDTDYMSRKIYP